MVDDANRASGDTSPDSEYLERFAQYQHGTELVSADAVARH